MNYRENVLWGNTGDLMRGENTFIGLTVVFRIIPNR
jgi:hypothetical protein